MNDGVEEEELKEGSQIVWDQTRRNLTNLLRGCDEEGKS